jgi:hypothetical protein
MKDLDLPDDLEQTILETFDEMHAEAQIVPIGPDISGRGD